MNILILGGTRFIGRHIAETLLSASHTLSILTRGQSPDELPATVERLRGDRDNGPAGLSALQGRHWDVCIDVSGYTPRQVRASAEALRPVVKRYIYVSAVSAYGDPTERPVRETQALMVPAAEDVTEVNGETYGALKVACENIVRSIYGARATVLRPQVVTGPHDTSGRFACWLERARRGGEMLAPGDGSDHLQFIDVRDLARFVKTVAERDIGGAFNMAGPRLDWAAFIALIGADNPVWVPAHLIKAAGLGFMDLPLYRPEHGPRASLMDVSNERARNAGLVLTDSAVTLRDVETWLRGQDPTLALAPEREAALIRAARQI